MLKKLNFVRLMIFCPNRWLVFAGTALLVSLLIPRVSADERRDHFERVIRPIFADACFKCHSVNAKKLKGGLLMDHIETLKSGGDSGASLVAGDPEQSMLVEAIRYGNVDLEMPPAGKLPDDQIAAIEKWVADGAYWPDEPLPEATNIEIFDWKKRKAEHWCWQPIENPAPPETGATVNDPLDHFIRAKLDEAGLAPAPETDRRTWLRRVTFDLIGLPPSRDELNAFLADESASAFETVVDRLLASPHFGERWGRHWLDLVRYAESCGHEFDYTLEHAHKYRDYVIRAFNADVPYDDLLREHIAGDLLPEPRRNPDDQTNESILGTGFWSLHEAVHAPTDVKQDEADRIDNQIDVFSKSFLGLTVSCARCHDHKFDAIPTKDYYAMAGYLQSSRRDEALLDPKGKIAAATAKLRDLRLRAAAEAAPEPEARDFASLLLAAQDVIDGNVKLPPEQRVAEPDILFEDFEADYKKKWEIDGEAFGEKPASGPLKGQAPIDGTLGKGFVTTYFRQDSTTGTATSIPFEIKRDFINLLVGGGSFKGQTCVQLTIGGEIVHEAVGQGGEHGEKLMPVSWDVRTFRGKEARLIIRDEHTDGWGHINVDHIVFSNESKAPAVKDDLQAKQIAHLAKERGLEALRLTKWIAMLRDKKSKSTHHPLHAWHKLQAAPKLAAAHGSLVRATADRDRKVAETAASETAGILADFGGGFDDVFLSGPAFGAAPRDGIASSRALSRKHHGVLRTKTFEIEKDRPVHFWVRGDKARVDLIIDGYYMRKFNGLLFGGTHIDLKGQHQWRRHSFNPSMYFGHRAWLEFTDYKDGYIEIAGVSKNPNALAEPISPVTTLLLDSPAPTSRDELASLMGRLIANEPGVRRDLGLPPAATDLTRQIAEIEKHLPAPQHAIAITEGEPEDEFVFIRGNPDAPGKVAPRQMLVAIVGENQAPPAAGSGRLDLVEGMVAGENPLTARVMVNRMWHHLFSRGIVPTVDDFGVMGLPPSHPELLDYLATDFQRDWDIKRMLRRLALSSTYRMSSRPEPAATAADPENLLFHRMPVRRLQAEAIRDSLLAISGRLDPKAFGSSIPVQLTPFQGGRGKPGSGPADGHGRRSIYLSIRRNFMDSFLMTFDFPTPYSTMGKRTVSNVPAQSLVMMNNPFVHSMAKRWAKNVHESSGTTDEKIARLYEDALARPPSESQRHKLAAFVGDAGDSLATWEDLAHIVINLKEFIYLN